jgi:membrane-associated phospholipid phosphatase
MRKLNENERILTIFGGLLVFASTSLAVATEVMTRKHLAEHQQLTAAVVQQGRPSTYEKHIAYEQITLKSRWSIPDGHAALGVAFATFGMILIAVPRAVAKKRSDS